MDALPIRREPFVLDVREGEHIYGDLRFPVDMPNPKPVIICHGFMSFKDWGFFPHVAGSFAARGYTAISFNFSRNGVVDHGNRITDFQSFEKNTFSLELSDLGAVIDALESGALPNPGGSSGRVALLGHSRGGGIAIVRASGDERVSALVTWSAIATFDRWTRHQKTAWRSSGYLPLARESAVSPLRLGVGILNDLESHPDTLDIEQAASRLRIPWLLVHGAADLTVPPREAHRLRAAAHPGMLDFREVEGVGHLYNAATREEDNYRTLQRMIDLTVQWLDIHFHP